MFSVVLQVIATAEHFFFITKYYFIIQNMVLPKPESPGLRVIITDHFKILYSVIFSTVFKKFLPIFFPPPFPVTILKLLTSVPHTTGFISPTEKIFALLLQDIVIITGLCC